MSVAPEKYPWITRLLGRKPFGVAAVVPANMGAHDLSIVGYQIASRQDQTWIALAKPMSLYCEHFSWVLAFSESPVQVKGASW